MTRERPNILLVDDDRDLLHLVATRLEAAGYAVVRAESGDAALAQLATSRPDVVVTDLRMQGMDGLALFEAIHRTAPSLPVVILTAHGTIAEAVAATRRGVFAFLTKPFNGDALLESVAQARRHTPVTRTGDSGSIHGIVTRSPLMQDLISQAERLGATEASVCIVGPSGSGKELLARAIHALSSRVDAPFVAVNCGAISEGLLESELFGHRRGAFTGATQDRAGLFQAATGGTLFLDEVGDMPPSLQVKLLRALEERSVRPVGANVAIGVDVRIVSATHRKLEERIAAGEFREDLYYRLNVVQLSVPGLADRREDIPLLARTFLDRISERYERDRLNLAPDATELLVSAPWPGNVRQLTNVLEQAAALTVGDVISAELVRQALHLAPAVLTPLDEARRSFERDYLVKILKIAEGNVTRAARLAGRNRTEFYRLLERHALTPAMFKVRAAATAIG